MSAAVNGTRTKLKERLGLAFRLSCLVATLLTLWWFLRGLDLRKLSDTLNHADLWLLLIAALLNIGAQVVRATSWTVMLGPRHPVPFGRLLGYEFAAQAASSITPARAGEALRLWMLKREEVPFGVTGALITLKKALGTLGITLLVVATPFLVPGLPGWVVSFVLLTAVFEIVQLLFLVLVAYRVAPEKMPRFLRGLIEGMYFLRDKRYFSLAFIIILVGEMIDITAAFTVSRALHIELSVASVILLVFFIDFANLIPVAPGHLGTFEVGALYCLSMLSVPQNAAFAFALLFHVQQALPQIVVGLPFHVYFLSVKRENLEEAVEEPTG